MQVFNSQSKKCPFSANFEHIRRISDIFVIAVRKKNETRQKLLMKSKDSDFCRSHLEENKSPVSLSCWAVLVMRDMSPLLTLR